MTSDADELERLRARVANLERMADRLAHELTTPLTTAHGFARVLLERGGMDEDVRAGLERIERASANALAILRSRMEEGVGDTPRSIRLRTLVRDAVTWTLGDGAQAGHDLPEEARVFADLAGLRAGFALLLVAIAEHAASRSVDPSALRIELTTERTTAYQVRIELDAPRLPVDESGGGEVTPADGREGVTGRLRRAESLFAAVGARLWLDDPGRAADQLSVLLEMPRDVGA